MGRWMAVSLVVGNMIGSGVFLLPASLALLGWNSVLGWLLTIAGGLCLAASFAWLAGHMPGGGPYGFARAAFGPACAFVVTWSYWISLWIGNAAIATAAISYLGLFAPGIATLPGGDALAAAALIVALTALNLRGARSAGSFQVLTTAIKLVPLLVVVVLCAAALAGGEARLPPLGDGLSLPAITAAATLTLWAFLGLESATVPAGQIEDPERTIPFATLVGTALTGLVYLFTCSAVILLMDPAVIAGSAAPFALFVERFWAPGPALAIAGFAAISAIGALNGWILVQGELPATMAEAGNLPHWFAVRNRHGTPARALLVSSGLMLGIVLLNFQSSAAEMFAILMLLATCCSLFMYLVCMLAVLRLRFFAGWAGGRYLPLVAGAATAYSAWTIYGAGFAAIGWGLVLLVAAIPVYWLIGRRA